MHDVHSTDPEKNLISISRYEFLTQPNVLGNSNMDISFKCVLHGLGYICSSLLKNK